MEDTVIYEIRVNPCPNVIQALDVVIHYDSASLEYIPYSLELPNISGFMTNTNIDGEVRFNAMDFEGFDFSEDKLLASVKFKVKDVSSVNLSLTNEIKAFIDNTTTDYGNTYIYDVTSVEGGTNSQLVTSTNHEDSDVVSQVSSDTDINLESVSSDEYISSEIVNESIVSHHTVSSTITAVPSKVESFATIDTPSENSSQLYGQPVNDNLKLYVFGGIVSLIAVGLMGIGISIAAKNADE